MAHSRLWVRPLGDVNHRKRRLRQLHLSAPGCLIAFVNAIDQEGLIMKTVEVRKIVKDNNLDLTVKGRSNGMVTVSFTGSAKGINTLNELLNGCGYELKKYATCFYVQAK